VIIHTNGTGHICFDIILGFTNIIAHLDHLHHIGALAQILLAFTGRVHPHGSVLLEITTSSLQHFGGFIYHFLHAVQLKTTWSIVERFGELEGTVPLCQHTDVVRTCPKIHAALSTKALRILRTVSCLTFSSSSCILAYTHPRAPRRGNWPKAFSVYHHLLGCFDHRLGVSVHRNKRLPFDDETVLLGIPVQHTLLEVYEPSGGILTGVRKEIPLAFRPSDVETIEYRS
jgi:hypothetical protein